MDFDEALRLAADPVTPAPVLREIATRQRRKARMLVAANPNAPADLLLDLTARYPEQVAKNPALDLLLLFQPDLLRKAPDRVRAALARCHASSLALLAQLADDGKRDIQAAVARNPHSPPDALARLCVSADEAVRSAALDNPASPPDVVALLERAGIRKPPQRWHSVEPIPERELRAVAAMAPWGRVLAAMNQGCPLDLLRALGHEGDAWTLVLGNPASPPDLIDEVAGRWAEHFDFLSLSNPRLTAEALRRVAACKGRFPAFAAALLRHPALDPATACALASQHLRDEVISELALRSPWADEALMAAILKQFPLNTGMALLILERGQLPLAIWHLLGCHTFALVRERVAAHPGAPADVAAVAARGPTPSAAP